MKENIRFVIYNAVEEITRRLDLDPDEQEDVKEILTEEFRKAGWDVYSEANLMELPVGTKFHVINGGWNGQIIDVDGEKHVLVFATGRAFKLTPDHNLEVEVIS